MSAVSHQTEQSRFVIEQDGQQAVLDYVLYDDNVIDFNRTYVPFGLRGKGLAEALVNAGLQWARGEGYSIKASCWYVAKFL